MPSKHVRFSKTNIVHSLASPALTYSPYSPASSGSILTPPSVMPGLPGPTPYNVGHHYSSYVPSKPIRAREHPLLEYHPRPVVDFDMINHHSYIKYHHHHIPSRTMSEAATSPPLPSITITSPHMPWSFSIYASNGSYVTLFDVFDTIYRKMHTNISPSEFAMLPSDSDKRRATRAFEARYSRHHSSRSREEEKRQGMKRIDFLMGHTVFTGITPTQDNGVWKLNTK